VGLGVLGVNNFIRPGTVIEKLWNWCSSFGSSYTKIYTISEFTIKY